MTIAVIWMKMAVSSARDTPSDGISMATHLRGRPLSLHRDACVMMKQLRHETQRGMPAMPSLQIRELPPDVYEALAYRAERSGRSLAQQAIVELRRAQEVKRQDRRREVLEEVKNRIARDGVRKVQRPPEELVREDRNR